METPELLKSFLEVQVDGHTFDLHNDFNVIRIEIVENVTRLILENTDLPDSFHFLTIEFVNSKVAVFNLDFQELAGPLTLDEIYRGRFERDSQLYEKDGDMSYYYVQFVEDVHLELFSESIRVYKS